MSSVTYSTNSEAAASKPPPPRRGRVPVFVRALLTYIVRAERDTAKVAPAGAFCVAAGAGGDVEVANLFGLARGAPRALVALALRSRVELGELIPLSRPHVVNPNGSGHRGHCAQRPGRRCGGRGLAMAGSWNLE